MRGLLSRFATAEPTLCPICRRRARWLGHAPAVGAAILWYCGGEVCGTVLRGVYTMQTQIFDEYEIGSRREGAEKAGAYLDTIGKTDLATLTREEFDELWVAFMNGFEQAMQRKLLEHQAPF